MSTIGAIWDEAVEVLSVAKTAVAAGKDALPFIEAAYSILKSGKPLSDAVRADLTAKEAALRTELDS